MGNEPATYFLGLLCAAVCALWARMTSLQSKMDQLIRDEAGCQKELQAHKAELQKMNASLETKHAENLSAIASLYCSEKGK